MGQGINKDVATEILSLEPSQVLEFYIIYYDWPEDPSKLLAITPVSNGLGPKIIWQGQEYIALPIEGSLFNTSGAGELPRPRLKISNYQLIISKYLKVTNNLIGAKIVRKRTFAKFLDDVNFEGGENPFYDLASQDSMASGDSYLPEQVFYVNRRVSENREMVELELSSVLELDNVFLPNRNVYARYCTWIYRGHGCRYTSDPKTSTNSQDFRDSTGSIVTPQTAKGKWSQNVTYNKGDFVFLEISNMPLRPDGDLDLNSPAERLKSFYVCVENGALGNQDFPPISPKWQRDECSKKISDCKLRFGSKLRFGGFPGTNAYPTAQ